MDYCMLRTQTMLEAKKWFQSHRSNIRLLFRRSKLFQKNEKTLKAIPFF